MTDESNNPSPRSPQSYEDWCGFARDPSGFSGDQRLNFGAPEGKSTAVAYSGFDGMNRSFAEQDCVADPDKYTIEQTSAGKYLDDARLYGSDSQYTRYQADSIWREASSQYANSAEGSVTTNVIDARIDRQFRNDELPHFLNNERVSDINGVPRLELTALTPQEQYDKICQAEIANDKLLAQSTAEESMQTRVEWKEMAYAEQHSLAASYTGEQSADSGPSINIGNPGSSDQSHEAQVDAGIQAQSNEILGVSYGSGAAQPEPASSPEASTPEAVVEPCPGIQEPAT